MKKYLLFVALLTLTYHVNAQNVFSASDTLLRWDASQSLGSPLNPNPNINGLQKWVTVETNGVSTGFGAFDASSFKSYYLRVNNRSMAFRLKYPKSYGNPDSAGKIYPIMLFFHGAGEPGCPSNGGIYNNEKHLLYGARFFRDKVDNNEFDGFLLYPQINTTNEGCWASSWGTIYFAPIVNLIDSLTKYVRADRDRVIADGLSSGGIAAWQMAQAFPNRISSIAPTSAVGGSGYDYNKIKHIPTWLASGEVDNNPSHATVLAAVNVVRALGGNIKHTEYPEQGHAVWDLHWQEPGFIPFMNETHKANPLIFFQHNEFCPDSVINVKLGLTPGFNTYEWQKDGVTIATSIGGTLNIIDGSVVTAFTGNEITVNALGTYRVRFKRGSSTPFSAWSPKPAVIQLKAITQTPEIQIKGLNSHILPSPDGHTQVPLYLPEGFTNYQWFQLPDSVLAGTNAEFSTSPGQYIARYAEKFGCGSEFSPVFTVLNANGSPQPDAVTDLAAEAVSHTGIRLSWNDTATTINGYELYRANSAGGPYTLIAKLPAGTHTHTNQGLVSNTLYYYIIRSVNDSAASAVSREVVAKTIVDTESPARPMNLRFLGGSLNTVSLRWNAAYDNVRVKRYDIYVNGEKLFSSRDTSFTAGGLDSLVFYTFKVQAIDEAGNVSHFSNEVTGYTQRQGLNYKYYHGDWNQLPDFNALIPVKTGITDTVSVNSGIRTQNDFFGFLWEGYIYIPEDDIYTFETSSDDGSKLYIDLPYSDTATAVVNNDGLHGVISRAGSIPLTKGYHSIAMTFFEKGGGEWMQVSWAGTKFPKEAIPKSVFSLDTVNIPPAGAPTDSIPPTAPINLTYKGSALQSVQLQWGASMDDVQLSHYDVYVNGEKRYSTTQTTFTASGLDSVTHYSFFVKAVDEAGNLSAASSQVSVFTHHPGLYYKYFHGSWTALPDFNSLTPVSEGITDTVTLSLRTQDENFGFLWHGFIFIPEDADYTFETNSDDGSKLYIDTPYSFAATALVNNDGLHAPETKQGSKFLSKGYHAIAITFFELGGGEVIDVYWSNDKNLARQRIPKSFLSIDSLTLPEPPLQPDSLIITALPNQKIQLQWSDRSENETGFEVLRSANQAAGFVPLTTTQQNIANLTDSALQSQTKYFYRVRSVNLQGESGFIQDSAVTDSIEIVLKAPSGLRAKLDPGNLITISWNDQSAIENGYQVWRKSQAEQEFILLNTTAPNSNAFTDTGTSPNTYRYFITAFNDTDTISTPDTVQVITGNIAPLLTISTSRFTIKTDTTANLNFSVNDAVTDSIYVSMVNNPAFISLTRTGVKTYRLVFRPGYDDIGWYTLTVRAKDDKGGITEKQVPVYVNDKQTRSVYINFGHSSLPAPLPWNNWTGAIPENGTKTNLRDEKWALTPFTVKMVQGMAQTTGLSMHTGHNTGVFPDTVLARGVRDPAASRNLVISGLDTTKRYNLIFAGSVNEGTPAYNSYAVGTQKDTLDIRYNSNETGNLNNLQPSANGEINVTINRLPGTRYIYLNGMVIEEYAPELTLLNPTNLYAEPVNRNTVALTWSDRTQYENAADGYELTRATDSLFTQNIAILSLTGNTTIFRDTGLVPGVKYWYIVRAKSGADIYSSYSNRESATTPSSMVLVNFNHNVPPAPAPWNNLAAIPIFNHRFNSLKDQDGVNPGIVLTLDKTFNSENNAGMNTGNNSGVVPDNVLISNYWLDKKQLGQFRASGLNHHKRYSFGFIGSIGPPGWYLGNYTATYTINGRTVVLNSWQNTTKIVYIHDVYPDEFGEVVISFSTTSDAAYGFNAGMIIFQFDPNTALPPSGPAIVRRAPVVALPANTEKERSGIKAKLYPNPFNDAVSLVFYNDAQENSIAADVHTVDGSLVKTYRFGNMTKGEQLLLLRGLSKNSPGTYIITLRINGKAVHSERLIKAK